jgi:hypothetical protein
MIFGDDLAILRQIASRHNATIALRASLTSRVFDARTSHRRINLGALRRFWETPAPVVDEYSTMEVRHHVPDNV